MAIDFSQIDNKEIGYLLNPQQTNPAVELGLKRTYISRPLKFRDFIKPYLDQREEVGEVLGALRKAGEEVNIAMGGNRPQDLETITLLAFSKIAIANAVDLISGTYQ